MSWHTTVSGTDQLVNTTEETIPEDYTAKLFGNIGVPGLGITNSNGHAVVFGVDDVQGTEVILKGQARDNIPYSNITDTGQTQLARIAQTNMQPPILTSTDFFANLGQPHITTSSNALFYAEIGSALPRWYR